LKRGKNALALMEDSEKRDAYLRVASSQQMLKSFLTELYWPIFLYTISGTVDSSNTNTFQIFRLTQSGSIYF